MLSKQQSVALRFIKGFIAAGISSMIVMVNAGVTIGSLDDLKKFGVALGVAFLSGLLMAIEKSLSWKP